MFGRRSTVRRLHAVLAGASFLLAWPKLDFVEADPRSRDAQQVSGCQGEVGTNQRQRSEHYRLGGAPPLPPPPTGPPEPGPGRGLATCGAVSLNPANTCMSTQPARTRHPNSIVRRPTMPAATIGTSRAGTRACKRGTVTDMPPMPMASARASRGLWPAPPPPGARLLAPPPPPP